MVAVGPDAMRAPAFRGTIYPTAIHPIKPIIGAFNSGNATAP